MANTPTLDREGKEIVTLDLGLGDAQMIMENDLTDFLEDTAQITGDPNDISPNNSDDDTPPPPPAKTTKTKTQPSTTGKSKEEMAAEARTTALAEEQRKKAELDKTLGVDDADPDNTESDTNQHSDDDDLASQIAAYSKQLYKLGVFTKDTEDESEELKTPEELLAKTNSQLRKGAGQVLESYLNRYGEKHRKFFDAVFEKGVDPEQYVAQYNKLESFKDMKLDNEANQEKVVIQAFRNQKWDEEDIKDEVQKLKNYKELESTAKKYHKGLVKDEEINLQMLEQQAEQERERLATIDEEYDSDLRRIYNEKLKEKDFGGIPLTEAVVTKAYDFAYNKKWELNGAQLTDMDRFLLDLKRPENREARAQLAALFAPTYEPGKPIKLDFSKIQKRAVSTKSTELFQDLATKGKQRPGGSSYQQAAKSFFD